MNKSYRTLAHRFHPDKNNHSQFFYVMQMINEDKEELKYTLRHYDAMREQERVRLAHTNIPQMTR